MPAMALRWVVVSAAVSVLLATSAMAGNPYCDKAFFWYPDGSMTPGTDNWASTFFDKGPCLEVSGIGTTQTFRKTILIIDRTDYTNTYMKRGDGSLAYAEELGIASPGYPQRPLDVITNTFCSSGAHVGGGEFFSVAGDMQAGAEYIQGKGGFSMRLFTPCANGGCDFKMDGKLMASRWYPTTQLLADGRMLIIGGSNTGVAINGADQNVPSLEYYPDKTGAGLINLDFLTETLPYNLYPFVHLLPNGKVFIYARAQYILWDTEANAVAPGKFPPLDQVDGAGNAIVRSYPLAGTSAMFTLSPRDNYNPEIIICGGSATPAYAALGQENAYAPGDDMCWRISPLAAEPKWVGQAMKAPRVLPLCALLPDGNLFIHAGGTKGHSGIPNAIHNATLTPEIYIARSHSWYTGPLGVSRIPRVYHASMILLHDTRVFISGSNPHQDVVDIIGEEYPTEMRTELYKPPYFRTKTQPPKLIHAPANVALGSTFIVSFKAAPGLTVAKLSLVLSQPGFSTHNFNHGMRQVELAVKSLKGKGDVYVAKVAVPPNKNILPATWYWLFVVVQGVPNREGHYVMVQ